jgi:hypothetical protein
MIVKNVVELFALDGTNFVTEVYRNLLMREPDEHGLNYYLGRLAQGYSKNDIIVELAKSPECRPLDEIYGLKKLVLEMQYTRHWFWRMFSRYKRFERAFYSGTTLLAQIRTELTLANQRLDVLQNTVQVTANEQTRQIKNLTQGTSQILIMPTELDELRNNSSRLSQAAVKQAYEDILGRLPETELISYHAKIGSRSALRKALIESGEFHSKLKNIPEYARGIFQRQIQIAASHCEE